MREAVRLSSRTALLLAALVLCGVEASAVARQQGPDAVVLRVAYADGRVSSEVVTRTPSNSWTPVFPRVFPGPPDGQLPVYSLDRTAVLLDDGSVRVDVSVSRGSARERQQAVATVTVSSGHLLRVDGLQSVGVLPITLSVEPFVPATLYPPTVVNMTAGLEVEDVEAIATPAARYRITVRNVSSTDALAFGVATYRGERPSLSGIRSHLDGRPVVVAGERYVFTLRAGTPPGTGEAAPISLDDRLELTGVLWADGTIEGRDSGLSSILIARVGRRAIVARALALLEAVAAGASPAAARMAMTRVVSAFSIEPEASVVAEARRRFSADVSTSVTDSLRTAAASARRMILADVQQAPDDPAAFARWLADAIAEYRATVARLSTP